MLSFLLSAFIIALLSAFLYLNFVEIKKETVFLELADTIRSRSLQLRRHEKNFLLYVSDQQSEIRAIQETLDDLAKIVAGIPADRSTPAVKLRGLLAAYREHFSGIVSAFEEAVRESRDLKRDAAYARVRGLVEANFLDQPLEAAHYLQESLGLRGNRRFIAVLLELQARIAVLRKSGESILEATEAIDKEARARVERSIAVSSTAILIVFPLFIVVGFGTLLSITRSVVRRLELLTGVVERAGTGHFAPLPVAAGTGRSDEVETLIRTFNTMEEQLLAREKELLQNKKLAAIGTLAAGVAHELNNPLSNIYTTAQRLLKKSGDSGPDYLKRGLNDIFGETMRVKTIVSDLLGFARGREPNPRFVELRGLVSGAWAQLERSRDISAVRLLLTLVPEEIVICVDPEQLEQVFLNLFANACDAMGGTGELSVRADEEDAAVTIRVSDTGAGMSRETLDKIFEPFFTTKDKGTGLGLAIVFNIVQKHGGSIRAESVGGAGTSFVITIPKAGPPAGPAAVVRTPGKA
ncbi:MAG: sensor histidine kinase [Candidatus Geothermincolia bacterium]